MILGIYPNITPQIRSRNNQSNYTNKTNSRLVNYNIPFGSQKSTILERSTAELLAQVSIKIESLLDELAKYKKTDKYCANVNIKDPYRRLMIVDGPSIKIRSENSSDITFELDCLSHDLAIKREYKGPTPNRNHLIIERGSSTSRFEITETEINSNSFKNPEIWNEKIRGYLNELNERLLLPKIIQD